MSFTPRTAHGEKDDLSPAFFDSLASRQPGTRQSKDQDEMELEECPKKREHHRMAVKKATTKTTKTQAEKKELIIDSVKQRSAAKRGAKVASNRGISAARPTLKALKAAGKVTPRNVSTKQKEEKGRLEHLKENENNDASNDAARSHNWFVPVFSHGSMPKKDPLNRQNEVKKRQNKRTPPKMQQEKEQKEHATGECGVLRLFAVYCECMHGRVQGRGC